MNHKMENTESRDSKYARNLIEAMLDPFITININGIITDANEAMVKATDKMREKLIGSGFSTYFIEEEKAQAFCREVFANEFVLNSPVTIIDGVTTDVLLNGSVFKNADGKVLGAVIVARDISLLKKIEKELIEAKVFAELTTEIAKEERSNAINAMRGR